MNKSIKELIVEVDAIVSKINQDLQLSTPSKFDGFQKVALAMSGMAVAFNTPFSGFINHAIEQEILISEIAAMANLTANEVMEFHQSHSLSLETIKAMVQAGEKLGKERTMEERMVYHWNRLTGDKIPDLNNEVITPDASWSDISFSQATIPIKQWSTFVVTLPNNDRREVHATYMKVDGPTLIFGNEDHETILTFGPGHWVWAERVDEDEATN